MFELRGVGLVVRKILFFLVFMFLGMPYSFAEPVNESVTVHKFELPNKDLITSLSEKVSSANDIKNVLVHVENASQEPIVIFDANPDSIESKEIVEQLRDKKIEFVQIDLRKPPGLYNLVSTKAKSVHADFKEWWKSKYEKPIATEKRWGVVTAVTRAGVSSMVWFSVGLDPLTAGTLVIGQTLAAYYNTLYERTVDNILGLSKDPKHRLKQMSFRLLYSTFWTYLWRGISGPIKGAHSLLTGQGNYEVLSNILSTGWAGNRFGMEKAINLSRKASVVIGFHGFLIGSVFTTLDLAGVNPYSWLINFDKINFLNLDFLKFSMEIKTSTMMILGYYFSAAYAVKKVPQYFEAYTNFIEKLITKVTAIPQNSCRGVFSKL